MPAEPPKASFPAASDDRLLGKLREWALVGAGLAPEKRLDSFLTLRMLRDAGVINVREAFLAGGGTAGSNGGNPGGRPIVVEPARDLTPPPPPGGFLATAGITQILFETAAPVYRQGHGHARTKVYAAPDSPLPTFADAVLYTDFPGNIGVAPFDPASSLRLWATWTSVDGKESEPAGGTNGVAAATGLLEDQHIANLVVGKLLAGSLAVGQYIQSADYVANTSGWRIQTLGGGGAFMEINGGAFIGGLVVGATYIQSSNYILNTQGYRFSSNGTGQIGGFQVTTNAIQSANYAANTTGWRLAYDGTGQIGAFTVTTTGIQSGNYVAGSAGWKITNAGSIEGADITLTGGLLKNSTDSFHMNMNATGSSLLLRSGPSTSYGPYAGTHYPVEIYADGSAFFGRGVVAGGQLKASGTYTIPDKERPAVIFVSGLGPGAGGGAPGDSGP